MKKPEINLKKTAVIFFSSVLMALIFNLISPAGINIWGEGKTNGILPGLNSGAKKNIGALSDNIINIVTSEEAYGMFREKKAVFIDARDQWDFAEGHIPGALNIPEYKFEENDPQVTDLVKNSSYVIYCGDDDCDVSMRLAEKLRNIGFTDLYVYSFGWKNWTEKKYPVEAK